MVGPGDEVVVPTFTFFATAGSVARLGAVPVFADIDPLTFNIDPYEIEKKITGRTKAIIPVHLFGQCADMNAIFDIAEQFGIAVIEDAAQSFGADYKGQRCGTLGAISCFSLEAGMSTFWWRALMALRTRASMSATGSVKFMFLLLLAAR